MPEINYLAVLAAAATSFLLGGLWYSPALFCKAWCREAGMPMPGTDEAKAKAGHPARVFGVAIVFAILGALAFAAMLGPRPPLDRALVMGAVAGLGIAATSFAINYAFAGKSTLLWLIDGGYHAVQFTLYGLVLGLWH